LFKIELLKKTAESYGLRENVFVTYRKPLLLRALCYTPDQLASSPTC